MINLILNITNTMTTSVSDLAVFSRQRAISMHGGFYPDKLCYLAAKQMNMIFFVITATAFITTSSL